MPDNLRAAMSEHKHPSLVLYAGIFFALIIGTCLTWGIAFQDLGVWNPVVALTIAVIKATLVILYFMHVRYSSKLTIVTVCAGFFWLMIMITLSLSDYLTRALQF
jgi:cytochrome c oxidase subunit IV